MNENRLFSIPYNGIDPNEYLNSIEPYKKNIENIYFGAAYLIDNFHSVRNARKLIGVNLDEKFINDYEENTHRFLLESKNKYKRIVVFNSSYYGLSLEELHKLLSTIILPYIEITGIDGCICTDFNMARIIHETFPKLEMHTSCNCFQWNIRQMEIWQKECGISVFNPPREILRSPYKLKEMKEAGFKLKCIVNEACLYGCPQTIEHCMSFSTNSEFTAYKTCNRGDIANIFRTNWVLPRWLDKLDKYVDIYKISGRMDPIEKIINTLDAFINVKEVEDITSIFGGCNISLISNTNIKIPSYIIPDKLLTCECKECNKSCFICEDLIKLCELKNKY